MTQKFKTVELLAEAAYPPIVFPDFFISDIFFLNIVFDLKQFFLNLRQEEILSNFIFFSFLINRFNLFETFLSPYLLITYLIDPP